jgi:hypothetical protein
VNVAARCECHPTDWQSRRRSSRVGVDRRLQCGAAEFEYTNQLDEIKHPNPVTLKGETHMIAEIVTFKLPDGMTHDDVVANFEKTAPSWQANPDLIRKNYLVDASSGVAAGSPGRLMSVTVSQMDRASA